MSQAIDIHDLYKIALGEKKPSKKVLVKHIEALVARRWQEAAYTERLTLLSLLNYLAPREPSKAALRRLVNSPHAWLSSSCAVCDARKRGWVEKIQVHGGVGYSSDGARLHITPVDMPDGSYLPHSWQPVAHDKRVVNERSVPYSVWPSGLT